MRIKNKFTHLLVAIFLLGFTTFTSASDTNEQNSQNFFEYLPEEIILSIIEYASHQDFKTLANIAFVEQRLKRISDDDDIFKPLLKINQIKEAREKNLTLKEKYKEVLLAEKEKKEKEQAKKESSFYKVKSGCLYSHKDRMDDYRWY